MPEKLLRVAFVLPGLHRVNRGAEVAFESIAYELAKIDGLKVTLIGSGHELPERNYSFIHAGCIAREKFRKWPGAPFIRNDCMYEELSFVPGLLKAYRPADYDVTVSCSYPYTNWVLRARHKRGKRPAHVYVTQNGDWPIVAGNREYRFFGCDGLVCTNPEFQEKHGAKWGSRLIPNGVDPSLFCPGSSCRQRLQLPPGVPLALMVSALIPSKRVLEGIRATSRIPEAHLIVAGDGPLRDQVMNLGKELMPGRFICRTFNRADMPDLYRSADVMLHMSVIESSANAYMEAMATGLPIVTHDRPTTRWTLEDAGILVDAENETAVAQGLGRAFQADSNTKEKLRKIIINRFTWSSIAKQYADYFRHILERRTS